MEITRINHCSVYIPKKFLEKLNLRNGDRVILKLSNHGILICKSTPLETLEQSFMELDEEMRKLLFKEMKIKP